MIYGFPITDKEIDVYFKLHELKEAKERAYMPLSMHGSVYMQNCAIDKYKWLKEEYLKMVNELKPI